MREKLYLVVSLGLLLIISACGGTETAAPPPEDTAPPAQTETVPQEPSQTSPAKSEVPAANPEAPAPAEPRGEEPVIPSTDREEMLAAYREILESICARYEAGGVPYAAVSDNRFALCDIDGDGMDELISEYTTASMAEQTVEIFGYDSQSGSAFSELAEFPVVTVYSGGVVEAPASHSQGRALDFWPYTLYQYDPAEDIYVQIARVDSWDRRVAEGADWDGIPFPAEVDADGDGVVYYLLTGDGEYAPHAQPVDNAAYEAWRASYVGGGTEIDIPWQALTAENIAALA